MTMTKSRKLIFLSFSFACVISIVVCIIVDFAINGHSTWSAYSILSVPFGWLIVSPTIIKKRGIILSLCSLTLFVLPFLYLLERITPVTNWFAPVGIPSAAVGIPTIWVIYLLFRFLKINLWYKSAIAVFLTGVIANPLIGYYVDMYLFSKMQLLNTAINGAVCLGVSVVLFLQGMKKATAKKEESQSPF